MKLSRKYSWLLSVLTVVAGSGCPSPFAPGVLRVTLSAEDSVVSPATPTAVQVVATNAGEGQVTWGPGSSTCQLHLLVRVDGVDVPALVDRVCTMDSRTYSLRPGDSRTEILQWEGLAQLGDSVVFLEPGTYEIRGAAGRAAASRPEFMEVHAGS